MWGVDVIKEMEILYMKYLKYIQAVRKNICKEIVYGEVGVYPVDITNKTRLISYWTRLDMGKPDKLAYKCINVYFA